MNELNKGLIIGETAQNTSGANEGVVTSGIDGEKLAAAFRRMKALMEQGSELSPTADVPASDNS